MSAVSFGYWIHRKCLAGLGGETATSPDSIAVEPGFKVELLRSAGAV